MSKKPSSTATGPTAMIAMEQYLPENEQVIKDDLSEKILPFSMRLFIKLMSFKPLLRWIIRSSEQSMPGIWSGLLARKLYINKILKETIDHYRAIINLGAGFDTRLYQYNNHHFNAWELDMPEIIEKKEKRVNQVMPSAHQNITLVPIDFENEKLREVLLENSYSFNQKTFIIIEGVTQYVTKEGIQKTLETLSDVKTGSTIVLTYVLRDLIEGKNFYGQRPIYEKYVQKDKTWINGYCPKEMEKLLTANQWEIIEDQSMETLVNQFEKLKRRNLETTVIERIVYAKKL